MILHSNLLYDISFSMTIRLHQFHFIYLHTCMSLKATSQTLTERTAQSSAGELVSYNKWRRDIIFLREGKVTGKCNRHQEKKKSEKAYE